MKNLILFLTLCLSTQLCQAQYFQGTINTDGNDLIFLIRANPGGGDITTDWSDIEFFVRWPNGSPTFNFGTLTVNTTNFPGVTIPNNGSNIQGTETGFTNQWFGSSFSVTPSFIYQQGVKYEVFRVTLDVPASTIPFELVSNSNFFPTYIALTSGTGGQDRTNPSGNKFYGSTATSCTNCPAAGTNYLVNATSLALPVELTSFIARATDKKEVQLTWITASELNNDYFTIERSLDGRNFEFMTEVSGAGTSSVTNVYQTVDKQPNMGLNYYRLKQTDFDGTFEYSEIRVVEFKPIEDKFMVYPNPTTDMINIRFEEKAGTGNIQLFSVAGQLVRAIELNENEYHQTIDLSDLPKGSYLMYLDRNGLKSNRKIIIQ